MRRAIVENFRQAVRQKVAAVASSAPGREVVPPVFVAADSVKDRQVQIQGRVLSLCRGATRLIRCSSRDGFRAARRDNGNARTGWN